MIRKFLKCTAGTSERIASVITYLGGPTLAKSINPQPLHYDPLDAEQRGLMEQLVGTDEATLDSTGIVMPDDDGEGFSVAFLDENGCRRKEMAINMFKGAESLWGMDQIKGEKPVFITTNRSDALMLRSFGYCSVSIGNQLEGFKEEVRNLVGSGWKLPLLVFYSDNDPERSHLRDLFIETGKVTHVAEFFPSAEDPYGDWDGPEDRTAFNSIMQFNPKETRLDNFLKSLDRSIGKVELSEKEKKQLIEEADYRKTSIAEKTIPLLDKFYSGDVVPLIPSGIPPLDEMLEGGFEPGTLAFLAAESSIGKTSLCAQIADKMAHNGVSVFFAEMDDDPQQIILKMVARQQYENWCRPSIDRIPYEDLCTPHYIRYHAPSHSEAQRNRVYDAAKEILGLKGDLYIFGDPEELGRGWDGHLTTGHLWEVLDTHRSIVGPNHQIVLIVDYVQLLFPNEPEEKLSKLTEKMILDKVIEDLARISKKLNVFVLAISSINRSSYGGPINLGSLKESGNLEYRADVILALQPAGLEVGGTAEMNRQNASLIQAFRQGDSDFRDVEVVMLKNKRIKPGQIELVNNGRFGDFGHSPNRTPGEIVSAQGHRSNGL